MLTTLPYTTWPLHVTLFSQEAAKGWNEVEKALSSTYPLPKGLEVFVEFEGVDGKSGHPGTGRIGPIDVMDGEH